MSNFWKVYIDDSADEHRKKYVLAGAVIGTKADWHRFEVRWKKALRQTPAISHFHGTDLRTLGGAFSVFRDSSIWPKPSGGIAANAKRDRLRKVIEESQLISIGVGVLVPDYEKVRASHVLGPTHMGPDVFEWVLQNTLAQSVSAIRKVDDDAHIRFIADTSNRAQRYEAVFADFKRKNPLWAQMMTSLVHMKDETCAGLQAADMVSSAVKGVYDDYFQTGMINKDIPLLNEFYRIGMIDEDYLLTVLNGQSVMTSETALPRFEPIKLRGKGPSASEIVLRDRERF